MTGEREWLLRRLGELRVELRVFTQTADRCDWREAADLLAASDRQVARTMDVLHG